MSLRIFFGVFFIYSVANVVKIRYVFCICDITYDLSFLRIHLRRLSISIKSLLYISRYRIRRIIIYRDLEI